MQVASAPLANGDAQAMGSRHPTPRGQTRVASGGVDGESLLRPHMSTSTDETNRCLRPRRPGVATDGCFIGSGGSTREHLRRDLP